MTRTLLVPFLLALALPAAAEDLLEAQLQDLEKRIARIRAEAKAEEQRREEITIRIADLDAAIAKAKKADLTAMGATKIEELRAEREKLEDERRHSHRGIKRESARASAVVAKIEKKREPIDLEGLITQSRKGDATARKELAELRKRIDAAIGVQPRPAQRGQVIGLGGRNVQRVRILNGFAVQGVPVPAQPAGGQPAQPPKPVKKLTPEEQEKADAADLTDQQKRAAALEKQIVEMTRKLMELERRVAELQEKVAKPDRG